MELEWQYSLDHSDWAESVRQCLRGPSREIHRRLAQASDLPPLWAECLKLDGVELQERVQRLLQPSDEFHCQWQEAHARAGPIFVPLTRIDPQLWRGPQPGPEMLHELRQEGLSMVFNLRRESRQSESLVSNFQLQCKTLPVQDMSVPEIAQLWEFLDYFLEPQGPALVHCFAGQGRTGLFVAAYRIWRGMEVDQAILQTDGETGRRGMRPPQREWVVAHAEEIRTRHART